MQCVSNSLETNKIAKSKTMMYVAINAELITNMRIAQSNAKSKR
jgi:hypothetical protein